MKLPSALNNKLLTIAPTLQPKAVAASCAVRAVCSKQIISRFGSKSLIVFSALLTGSLFNKGFTINTYLIILHNYTTYVKIA